MHPTAYADAQEFVAKYLDGRGSLSVADVGSYDVNGTLKPLFARDGWTYTGLDIAAGPNVDQVLPSAYDWPAQLQGRFDVVVSTQVVEHVPHPWRWIRSVAGLAKPGGMIYISTPNTIEYHPYPVDCWRIWPDGMRALFEEAGIEVVDCYAKGRDTTGIGVTASA